MKVGYRFVADETFYKPLFCAGGDSNPCSLCSG